jgi:hypothetical protein
VDAEPEPDMTPFGTLDLEPVGVVEPRRVSVRRSQV